MQSLGGVSGLGLVSFGGLPLRLSSKKAPTVPTERIPNPVYLCIFNSSSNLGKGPLVRSYSIFQGFLQKCEVIMADSLNNVVKQVGALGLGRCFHHFHGAEVITTCCTLECPELPKHTFLAFCTKGV